MFYLSYLKLLTYTIVKHDYYDERTLENTERPIKIGESRGTGNIGSRKNDDNQNTRH
jgi:hypothetical protein